MDKFIRAIEFATKAHQGQTRKGTDIPYITHPIAVMEILAHQGCSDDVIIAGVLHDIIEDTDYTFSDLQSVFGQQVASLVQAVSEPSKETVLERRKEHTISIMRTTEDKNILLLCCADKMHNISCSLLDYDSIGEKLWDRFERGADKQAWYYASMAEAFLLHDKNNPFFQDYANKVQQLFTFKAKIPDYKHSLFLHNEEHTHYR